MAKRKVPTKAELQQELSEVKAANIGFEQRIKLVVRDLADRTQQLEEAIRQRESFHQAAKRIKLQYDGTVAEMEKLLQRKAQWGHENQVAHASRENHIALYEKEKAKAFDLEQGISEQVATAEGKAMFYKEKLTGVLRAVDEAKKESGL